MPEPNGWYEVVLTGLTHNSKVWSKGELIPVDKVPAKVRILWDTPEAQKKRYGKYVVRPRPFSFAVAGEDGNAVGHQEIPDMLAPAGMTEEIGTGFEGKTTVGVNQPAMSPDTEIGVSMSS